MADAGRQKGKRRMFEVVRLRGPDDLQTADIELTNSAPSPIRGVLALTICGALVTGVLVSLVFSVDIHAVASARVQPTGRSKILQASSAGRVVAVHVANGSKVEVGEVLVELDATETSTDHAMVLAGYQARDVEVARRGAAIKVAEGLQHSSSAAQVTFAADASEELLAREREVLKAELNQLSAGLDVLETRIAETSETRNGLIRAVEDDDRLIGLLQEQATIRQDLHAKGLETTLSMLDAKAALERARALRTSRQIEIAKAGASMEALRAQQRDLLARFIAENAQARSQALDKREDLRKSLIKATDKMEKTRLLAPISGTVQELVLTTAGQVIAAGEQLMVVVPSEASLEVEAMVGNRDIGFIKEGQSARVKLDAFPFAKYGVVPGRISRISHDAVDQSAGSGSGNAGARPTNPSRHGAAPVPQTTNLVYPVTILLDRDSIRVGDSDVRLSAGMTATVEIKTGRRRIIEYLLSPLVRTFATAGHER